ncbi:hypothetical protein LMG28614_05724 [Paraburkholderia ultramafica]|uniref:Uncharacterized protein n=1 Tax=Paraburkholderia ultramafica TaxID=1544867 RepID=A0A6S7DE83_9BURK|nr:hypothetical protein [Paraburkholderia ultramafica]CAB3803028.1 hypothetical protein LMG28614_05724 [Paraburkholderia ultramafica]
MNIAGKCVLVSALMIGLSGATHAQSASSTPDVIGGVQPGGINGADTGASMGLAPGVGSSPGTGIARGAATIGGGMNSGLGAPANNMRANGTSLYMNPDPRAPNVTGRAFVPH